MQLMPDTAAEYGVKEPFSVTENLRGGIHYLADLLRHFHGEMRLAVAAYYGAKDLDSKKLSYSNPNVVVYVESVRFRYLRELRTELPGIIRGKQEGSNHAYQVHDSGSR